MEPRQSFGNKIKVARKLKYKQDELAALLEVKPAYICQIEKGKKFPSESFLQKICEYLGLDFDSLLSELRANINAHKLTVTSNKLRALQAHNEKQSILSPQQLGEKLKVARGDKFTQKALAEQVGVSDSLIAMIETGCKLPSDSTLESICIVLELNYITYLSELTKIKTLRAEKRTRRKYKKMQQERP